MYAPAEMIDLRLDTVRDICDVVYNTWDKVVDFICTMAEPRECCHDMILGSYTSFLFKNKFLPHRIVPADYHPASEGSASRTPASYSPRHLADICKSIKIRTLDEHSYDVMASHILQSRYRQPTWTRPEFTGKGLLSHSRCAEIVDVSRQVMDIFNNMRSVTSDSHRLHMEEQAKK